MSVYLNEAIFFKLVQDTREEMDDATKAKFANGNMKAVIARKILTRGSCILSFSCWIQLFLIR
jgi:hypothetical protein